MFFISMSNLVYVGFALNRLSLVGKDHDMITQFVSRLSITKFLIFSTVFSIMVSIVKPLQYNIYRFVLPYPEVDVPILFTSQDLNNIENKKSKLIFIFNSVYDLINYCLFVGVNMVIDIVLLGRLRRVTKEREAKFNCQSEKLRNKIKEENYKSVRDVIVLVLMNSLLNFLLKIPITITTLNDFRLEISISTQDFGITPDFNRAYRFSFTFDKFCYLDRACRLFLKFGQFLYILSLSNNLFFMKRFDKKFRLFYQSFCLLSKKAKS